MASNCYTYWVIVNGFCITTLCDDFLGTRGIGHNIFKWGDSTTSYVFLLFSVIVVLEVISSILFLIFFLIYPKSLLIDLGFVSLFVEETSPDFRYFILNKL
jgi:hypothetical protein